MKYVTTFFVVALTFLTHSNALVLEAEDGVLTGGASVESDAEASGGSFVNLRGGELTLSVEIEELGYFDIYLKTATQSGFKANVFSLNGQSITFNTEASEYVTKKIVSYAKLSPGEHTIKVSPSWGWIDIDTIELVEVDPSERFDIATHLVTPNPSNEAINLYRFLQDNYGQKIISGVSEMSEVDWLEQNTGKRPALLGLDYLFVGRGYEDWYDEDLPFKQGKAWHEQNGIVNFHWHWRDPSRITEEFYTESTDFDVSKIFDHESPEYVAMIEDIDFFSAELKRFQELGIPVLWRPLHEASGGWFWWGAKGPEPLVELWRIMFDRMVNHHGLNNLIWVWTDGPDDDAWYPGDEYVDIVGRDIYKTGDHSSQILEFNEMNDSFSGGKLLALTEVGSMPDSEVLVSDEAIWSWFMVWNGDFVRQEEHNSLALWQKVLDSDYVITLDEMPDLTLAMDRDGDGVDDANDPWPNDGRYSVDTDYDLLADEWETTNFSTLERDGVGDFDQDGFSDFFEFLADLNPKDKTSQVRLQVSREGEKNVVRYGPCSVSARIVLLEYREGSWEESDAEVTVEDEHYRRAYDHFESGSVLYRFALSPQED